MGQRWVGRRHTLLLARSSSTRCFVETLKLTFRVYLNQATSHGCHGLYDQIRIPRRLPRPRRNTTRKHRRKSKKHRTTMSIEYHCRHKLLVQSCGHWNHSLALLNRTVCYDALQYVHCLTPLKMKCQNMLSNDADLVNIQTFLQKCYKIFTKSSKNHIDGLTSNISFIFLSLLTYALFKHELDQVLDYLSSLTPW